MATSPPSRLVTVIIIFSLAVHITLATAIPKLLPVAGGIGSVAKDEEEAKQVTNVPDHQAMVTKAEAADGDEVVVIRFSYADENKNQQGEKNDDPSRYSYNIIDAPRVNAVKLIPAVSENDPEGQEMIKDGEENQNPSEEGVDPLLQLNARRQIEAEENLPGSHNWPKHIPDYLRPLSPFPEEERVFTRGRSFIPERQRKRDEAFVPSERLPPPERAGPYLYPQSIVDREFRIPFN